MFLNTELVGTYEAPVPPRPEDPLTMPPRGEAAQPAHAAAGAHSGADMNANATASASAEITAISVAQAPAQRDSDSAVGRRPLLDADELRASGNAEQFP